MSGLGSHQVHIIIMWGVAQTLCNTSQQSLIISIMSPDNGRLDIMVVVKAVCIINISNHQGHSIIYGVISVSQLSTDPCLKGKWF